MNTSSTTDVYQIVNERIIALLEQGTVPWQQPWQGAGIPSNLVSKRPYSGINVWLLSTLNYPSNYYLTYAQLTKLGALVRKGEKSHIVVFWKRLQTQSEADSELPQSKFVLRYYRVFNIEQCENLPLSILPVEQKIDVQPIEACEQIVTHMPLRPNIIHLHGAAFYHHLGDFVNIPRMEHFHSPESYYQTLFHELVHATGHPSRLNRPSLTSAITFGSETYSMEELIAEMGASYLTSCTGIFEEEAIQSAAYISGWLKTFKNEKRFLIRSAAQAQKAVDFILRCGTEVEK